MSDTSLLLGPTIAIGGRPLSPDTPLAAMRIQRSLCLISRATLRFDDPGFSLSADSRFALGADVKISLDGTELFAGQITGVSLDQQAASSAEFLVTADDKGHALARSMSPSTYLKASYSDVIRQLCSAASLTAKVSGNRLDHPNDYLLRTGSALDYLDRMARRTGTVWWVEGSALNVADAGTSTGDVTLQLGAGLTEFSVRASGLRPTASKVSGWDLSHQQSILGEGTAEASAASNFVHKYLGTGPNTLGEGTATSGNWFPTNADRGRRRRQFAARRRAGGGRRGPRGDLGERPDPPVRDGEDHRRRPRLGQLPRQRGRARLYPAWLLHPLRRRPAPSRSGWSTRWGRRPADPGFSIPGLVVGKVTDNDDPETARPGQGEVRRARRCDREFLGAGRLDRRRCSARRGHAAGDQRRGAGRLRVRRQPPPRRHRRAVQPEQRAAGGTEAGRERQGRLPADHLAQESPHRDRRRRQPGDAVHQARVSGPPSTRCC